MRWPLLLLLLMVLTGCCAAPGVPKEAPSPAPAIPVLRVWDVETATLLEIDIETYVAGVVAGEMPSAWPMEALKAQAILARTYVLKFISGKESRYPGADISTDIAEAQAYDAAAIDARVLTAVRETHGQILLHHDGALPYTWFHAHSGGRTALAREALDWQGDEPAHTRVTDGCEAAAAPWSATFTTDEFLAACRSAGYGVATCQHVTIGESGPSGRAVTLLVDGVAVNAARLRISLGSTRMRSTLLTELSAGLGTIRMAGHGYGHGVGMSQWGAKALAEAGWTADEIALHYYNDLTLVRVW